MSHKAVSHFFPHSVSECSANMHAVTWADRLLYERVAFPVWFWKEEHLPSFQCLLPPHLPLVLLSANPTPTPAFLCRIVFVPLSVFIPFSNFPGVSICGFLTELCYLVLGFLPTPCQACLRVSEWPPVHDCLVYQWWLSFLNSSLCPLPVSMLKSLICRLHTYK